MLLGHTTVCAVEIEPYCRKVLLQRQRDGILPKFPIWDDVRTFDGKPWKGRVDRIAGGFPCQDISPARSNNHINGEIKGLSGARSGLWSEYKRIIGEVEPDFVDIENSPQLRTRGLNIVLTWGVLGVRQLGADHIRERLFIAATHSNVPQCKRGSISSGIHQANAYSRSSDWWKSEPGMERVAHGMASRLDRLRAIGNGQVPIVAATAWKYLS